MNRGQGTEHPVRPTGDPTVPVLWNGGDTKVDQVSFFFLWRVKHRTISWTLRRAHRRCGETGDVARGGWGWGSIWQQGILQSVRH